MIKQGRVTKGALVGHGRTVALPCFICTGSSGHMSSYVFAGSWAMLTAMMQNFSFGLCKTKLQSGHW